MRPHHTNLSKLLREAASERGGQGVLAHSLGLHPSEVSDLITGKRFITVRQALKVEAILDVPADDLWTEACIAKGREMITKARGRK